jgi:hypothetical protein
VFLSAVWLTACGIGLLVSHLFFALFSLLFYNWEFRIAIRFAREARTLSLALEDI